MILAATTPILPSHVWGFSQGSLLQMKKGFVPDPSAWSQWEAVIQGWLSDLEEGIEDRW